MQMITDFVLQVEEGERGPDPEHSDDHRAGQVRCCLPAGYSLGVVQAVAGEQIALHRRRWAQCYGARDEKEVD